jgi:radical SAM protein with 4Fe4S-binding SPASM domain
VKRSFVSLKQLSQFPLWKKLKHKRVPISFDLEITARCNNNCRHCYINLPAVDKVAKKKELSLEEIKEIAEQAVSLGSLWCLITGGEPLLREDFFDIYLCLKRKGLLVSVFTNAALITEKHIRFLNKYPPRDVEVTVYGVTQDTYEHITRKRGSFAAFSRGLDLLLRGGIKVRLKAMAFRSNIHEIEEIARFCRKKTMDYFRFDPFLHLRCDGNQSRNKEIKRERLSAQDISALEAGDAERFGSLQENCDKLIVPELQHVDCKHLFWCGAGNTNFAVGYDGLFRLCSSLWHPDCVYDLRKGSLWEAWEYFVPKVREMHSNAEDFLDGCRICPIINLCMYCPAIAHLETGRMDARIDYFCEVAHARARMLK